MATTTYIHLAEVYCNSPLRHQILVVPSIIQYQLQTIALLLPTVVGLFFANKISTQLLLPKEKITCAITLIQMKSHTIIYHRPWDPNYRGWWQHMIYCYTPGDPDSLTLHLSYTLVNCNLHGTYCRKLIKRMLNLKQKCLEVPICQSN